MEIPFATQSYTLPSLPISAQNLVNAYAEREPPDAKTQIAVLGAPGLTAWATCGQGPIRGFTILNGVLYVVSGPTLYSVSQTGTATPVGGAISGDNIVSITNNGTQICITNGVTGYIYTVNTGFTVISDPNFHAANTVTFFDNYFVFDWAGTNKFFISGLLDGTIFNGLGFASAEVSPDFVISILVQQENLLIFGAETIELWIDEGLVTFPFSRVNAGTLERGCAAPLTPVKEDNSVFFLGNDLMFYRLDNLAVLRRVSQHAIEAAWQSYATVSDAFTFSYTWEGHKFIVLTFPTANATWVYDVSTSLWHERKSYDLNGQNLGRWLGNCHINCYGLNLIGDANSGAIGMLDPTVMTEFGKLMLIEMSGPPVEKDRKRLFHSVFELDMETGVGVAAGQGSDPQVMECHSDDSGRTWSELQSWSSLGKIGAYSTRVRWTRLGQSRQRIYKIQISDPVRRTVVSASANLAVGTG